MLTLLWKVQVDEHRGFYSSEFVVITFHSGFRQSLKFHFPETVYFSLVFTSKRLFFPEFSWKWILFPGLNFTTHLINLYIFIYIYISISIYLYISIYIYIYIYITLYILTYLYIYIYIYILHIYVYVCICICICMFVCIYVYVYMYESLKVWKKPKYNL